MKTKKTIESKPWIKPGWNKKRENNEMTWQQVKRLVAKARTDEGWKQSFLELPIRDQWDILYKYHAPPKEIKAESGISVTLNITGLDKPHEIQGELVEPKQLLAHDDDDPTDD